MISPIRYCFMEVAVRIRLLFMSQGASYTDLRGLAMIARFFPPSTVAINCVEQPFEDAQRPRQKRSVAEIVLSSSVMPCGKGLKPLFPTTLAKCACCHTWLPFELLSSPHGHCSLSWVQALVLDEADRLLDLV